MGQGFERMSLLEKNTLSLEMDPEVFLNFFFQVCTRRQAGTWNKKHKNKSLFLHP